MHEKIKRFLKEKKALFLKAASKALFRKRSAKEWEASQKEGKAILLKIQKIHKKKQRGEKLNLFEKYYTYGYSDEDLDVYSTINVPQ